MQLTNALSPSLLAGGVQLFLSAADHQHMKSYFIKMLNEIVLKVYATVSNTEGVTYFRDRLLDLENEPLTPVTLFFFNGYLPDVATTNILSRIAYVLACRKSELAFYLVPMLVIRRVGDNE